MASNEDHAQVEHAECTSTTMVVPLGAMDAFGPTERAGHLERITLLRNGALPGLEVWDARDSLRQWKVFHETFAVCSRAPGYVGSSSWRYRGREHEMTLTTQRIFEPGLAHQTLRLHGPPASFFVVLLDPDVVTDLLGEAPPHLHPLSRDPKLQRELWQLCLLMEDGRDPIAAQAALASYVSDLFSSVGEKARFASSTSRN